MKPEMTTKSSTRMLMTVKILFIMVDSFTPNASTPFKKWAELSWWQRQWWWARYCCFDSVQGDQCFHVTWQKQDQHGGKDIWVRCQAFEVHGSIFFKKCRYVAPDKVIKCPAPRQRNTWGTLKQLVWDDSSKLICLSHKCTVVINNKWKIFSFVLLFHCKLLIIYHL